MSSKVHMNTSFNHYLKMKGLNNSRLNDLDDSAAVYKHREDHPEDDTVSTNFGSGMHSVILEDGQDVIVIPEFNMSTIDGKAEYEAHLETVLNPPKTANGDWEIFMATVAPHIPITSKKSKGQKEYCNYLISTTDKIIVSQQDSDKMRDMLEVLKAHPAAGPLLFDKDAHKELSIEFEHRGRPCKCRIDVAILKSGLIVDYKTTACAKPHAFRTSMHKYGYYRQAPFYELGSREIPDFNYCASVYVAQEKVAPYPVMVYQVDQFAMERGYNDIEKLFTKLEECEADDHWPAGPETIEMIGLPTYAMIDE